MKTYEYMRLTRPYACGECENGSGIIEELNILGQEGWELVYHTIHWNTTSAMAQYWVLKREK